MFGGAKSLPNRAPPYNSELSSGFGSEKSDQDSSPGSPSKKDSHSQHHARFSQPEVMAREPSWKKDKRGPAWGSAHRSRDSAGSEHGRDSAVNGLMVHLQAAEAHQLSVACSHGPPRPRGPRAPSPCNRAPSPCNHAAQDAHSPGHHHLRAASGLSKDGQHVEGPKVGKVSSEKEEKRTGKNLWAKGKIKISVAAMLQADKNSSVEAIMLENEFTSLPILSGASPAFISKLTKSIRLRPFKEGEVIVNQGSSRTSLILVVRGTVDILIGDVKVAEMTHAKNHSFGECNLIGLESQWTVTLRAQCRCDIAEVRREQWEAALADCSSDRRRFYSVAARNQGSLADGTVVKRVKILQGLKETTIAKVDLHVVRRLYFPGEKILVEGEPGSEFMMLVQGHANVEIGGRVVRSVCCGGKAGGKEYASEAPKTTSGNVTYAEVSDEEEDEAETGMSKEASMGVSRSVMKVIRSSEPECFGELGFFGLQELRTASVVAQTVCQVRILFNSIFLQTLEDAGESLVLKELSQFMEDRYHGKRKMDEPHEKMRLREINFFDASCSDAFLSFLATHLEDRVFLTGQHIKPEENGLYIVSKGSVDVFKSGVQVSSRGHGSVLGKIAALGLGTSEPLLSFQAGNVCFIRVLHQSVIVRGLELFPEDRQKILLMTFRRLDQLDDKNDDDDDMKRQSVSSRKSVSRKSYVRKSTARYTLSSGISRSLSGLSGMAHLASSEKDDKTNADWKIKTHKAFMRAMQNSQLFVNVSVAFLEHLSSVAIDRIYMPGDLIIEEGKRGDSMFILVSGSAGVFARDNGTHIPITATKSGEGTAADPISPQTPWSNLKLTRIGNLAPGSISGELAMLGVLQYRSATIKAETLCSMWEITQENALSILNAFPEARRQFGNIVLNRLERTAPTCVFNLPMFQPFDRKFRMLLGLYCEKKAFFPGQVMVKEGSKCDGMIIINMGRAALEKCTVAIKTYTPGMHFMCTVMLGVHTRAIGSLISLATCHSVTITRNSFVLALEKYPCHGLYQELKSQEIEAYNEFLRATQRIAARKMVWKRYQTIALTNDWAASEEKQKSDKHLMQDAFDIWKRFSTATNKERTLASSCKKTAEDWVQRQRAARERRHQQDEEQYISRHASERDCHMSHALAKSVARKGTGLGVDGQKGGEERKDDGEIADGIAKYLPEAGLPQLASPRPAPTAKLLSPFSAAVIKFKRLPEQGRARAREEQARSSPTHGMDVAKRLTHGMDVAKLPFLAIDDGYTSDADHSPMTSARRQHPAMTRALNSARAMTRMKNTAAGIDEAGGYLYPAVGLAKQPFAGEDSVAGSGVSDSPGRNHTVLRHDASNTQIFWQGISAEKV